MCISKLDHGWLIVFHLIEKLLIVDLRSLHGLFFPTIMTTFLITGFSLFWNSSSIWITFANYQNNNSHNELHFLLSVYIHLPRYPLSSFLKWVWYPFLLLLQQCLSIKLVNTRSEFCRKLLYGRVSLVFNIGKWS